MRTTVTEFPNGRCSYLSDFLCRIGAFGARVSVGPSASFWTRPRTEWRTLFDSIWPTSSLRLSLGKIDLWGLMMKGPAAWVATSFDRVLILVLEN